MRYCLQGHCSDNNDFVYCPICGSPFSDEKQAPVNNIVDDKGNIIDKKIKKDVNHKVDWFYVNEKLCFARQKVKIYELYKRKITEVNEAVAQEDIERAIDIMYFEVKDEITPEPLEKMLRRYWSTDDSLPPWKTTEERKEEARRVYQEREIAGFKRIVKLHTEIYFKSEDIDGMIAEAKDELIRIETIVEHNSPSKASKLLWEFGECHRLWGIEKAILKTDYGIEWQTPDERYPDVYFD